MLFQTKQNYFFQGRLLHSLQKKELPAVLSPSVTLDFFLCAPIPWPSLVQMSVLPYGQSPGQGTTAAPPLMQSQLLVLAGGWREGGSQGADKVFHSPRAHTGILLSSLYQTLAMLWCTRYHQQQKTTWPTLNHQSLLDFLSFLAPIDSGFFPFPFIPAFLGDDVSVWSGAFSSQGSASPSLSSSPELSTLLSVLQAPGSTGHPPSPLPHVPCLCVCWLNLTSYTNL